MRLGVQVSIAGRISQAVERALSLNCRTMQIFSRNPRSWQVKFLQPEDIAEFKRRRGIAGIEPLVVHAPYIFNLASAQQRLYHRSIQGYIEDIERAEQLGAEYFVTHCGSHKGKGEAQALRRFATGLNIVLRKARPQLKILLENTAGSGYNLGYSFAHLQEIIADIDQGAKVGICLDTAHAYAAGFDIAREDGIERLLNNIKKLVGLHRLKVIHLNDTTSNLGARIDRHQHIGKGRIGIEGIDLVVNHPRLKSLAFILETPKMGLGDDKINLERVRAVFRN